MTIKPSGNRDVSEAIKKQHHIAFVENGSTFTPPPYKKIVFNLHSVNSYLNPFSLILLISVWGVACVIKNGMRIEPILNFGYLL
jgi:hypothetical protein